MKQRSAKELRRIGPPTVAGRARRMVPFAAAFAVAFAVFPATGESAAQPAFYAALNFTILALACEIFVPWGRAMPVLRLLPSFLALVSIALLRDAAAGSVYSMMVIVVVTAVAMYGNWRDLAAILVASAIALLGPLALGMDYPGNEWGRAITALFIAGLVGTLVKRLVDELEQRRSVAEQQAQELAQATERFDHVVETAPIGMAWVALDGRIERANAAFAEMLGRSVEQVVGTNFRELTHPDDVSDNVAVSERLVSGEVQGFQTEKRYLRPDGSVVWALLNTSLERDSSRQPLRFVSQIQDISALHEARLEAERSLNDLERVVEATGQMGSIADASEAQRRIAEAAQQITGASVVSVWQPNADGSALVSRASIGADMTDIEVPFERESSGSVWAFRNRRRLFASTAAGHPHVSQRLVALTGIKSILFEPLLSDDGPIGVLAVGWREPVHELPARTLSLVELLANEAARALERARLVLRLDELAQTDPLTGLPNRRHWEEQLPRELHRAARTGEPLSVALIDIDLFKQLNDRRGHQAGDRLLRGASARWRGELRATDVLCRFGGDEFGLLLPACDAEQAQQLMERLRASMPAQQTCSIGLSEWNRKESAAGLILRADRALYAAKQSGRDKVIGAT